MFYHQNSSIARIIFPILFITFFMFLFGDDKYFLLFFIILIITLFQKHKDKFLKNNIQKEKIIDLDKIKFNKNKIMQNFRKKMLFFIFSLLLAWFILSSIVIIDAGETGVYSLFGRVKDKELSSGLHFVIPLARITRMSIRTEEYTMSIARGEGKRIGADAIQALTKEGLSVNLDLTVFYRLEEDKASDVYKELGIDYEEKIIRPTIRTAIRNIVAKYEAKDIYSEKREEVIQQITELAKKDLKKRGILIEEVLLRNVNLPNRLTQSIQEKLQAEQEAQKYDFLLEKEKKEKQRKIIEAEGQRDAQKIINESLSPNYLYYLYISNLKDREGTIYVPTSPSTGMPLFKDIGK